MPAVPGSAAAPAVRAAAVRKPSCAEVGASANPAAPAAVTARAAVSAAAQRLRPCGVRSNVVLRG